MAWQISQTGYDRRVSLLFEISITINIVMLVCIKHKIKYLKKVTHFVALQISYAKNILQLHCTNNFLYRNVACKFGGFNYQLILAVYDCF